MENYLKKINQRESWKILKILFLNQNSQFFQRIPCKQNFQLDKCMKIKLLNTSPAWTKEKNSEKLYCYDSLWALFCKTEAHLAVLQQRAQSLQKLSVLSRVSPAATLNASNGSWCADSEIIKKGLITILLHLFSEKFITINSLLNMNATVLHLNFKLIYSHMKY